MADPLLSYAQGKQPEIVAFLRRLVECESPSDDAQAVNRFVEMVSDELSPFGAVRTFPGGKYGRHFQCEFHLPGKGKHGRILALGHSDTVWPAGTVKKMPFRDEGGRISGPGVLDMKAGIAFFTFAMQAVRELDLPVSRKVVMQLNSDEEVGSESSRPLTEREARRSEAVLVLEPATGLDGKLKTARKGVGDYTIVVHGRAAHAGLDFANGANAILELARQLEQIAQFTNLERGVTVSPGIINGGSRPNVVPDHARAEVDIRVLRLKDAEALDRKFRRLRPVDKRCRVEVLGGLNRPPMERSKGVLKLFGAARTAAEELGIALEESTSGGGSDGNFTAALGIPTLDGLGGVGEGAHAPHEYILADCIAERTALLGKLVTAV